MADDIYVRIGVLVPLSRPGWVESGRHLLAGLELAVRDANDTGGVAGRLLGLVVRDTAADPHKAAAAVDELAYLGVTALAGEYHSVVARAAAARADALGLPSYVHRRFSTRLPNSPPIGSRASLLRNPVAGRSTRNFSLARGTAVLP